MENEKTPPLVLQKIDAWLVKISRWISYIVGASLLLIMLLAFCDIIVAKFFNSMIPNATEWITYLNVFAVFPAVAYVQLSRGHTNVEFLNGLLPGIGQKILRYVGYVLGAVVSFVIAWRAFILMGTKIANTEKLSTSALSKFNAPVWPFTLMLALGCFFMGIAFAWCIVREAAGIKPPAREEEDTEAEMEGGGESV